VLSCSTDPATRAYSACRWLCRTARDRARGAGITVAIESAKRLCYAAATRVDVGVGTVEDAALAKLVATDTANAVVDRALQVFGAAGWVRGYPLEWLYRYVRAMSMVEGTSEIRKIIIARGLGLG
jgi:alkylation response protein AidB-like acyl-CoA dehydrogenase